MDGGHERPEINLKKVWYVLYIGDPIYIIYKLQVIFWPDNIVSLLERFGVKKKFDFLSEDSDSYDFFMTEAILEVS